MWEKKTGSAGDLASAIDCTTAGVCPDPHDVNNVYTWSNGAPWDFTGTVATVFLKQLNNAAFAGYSDWRLPTTAGSTDYPTGSDPEWESLFSGFEQSIFGPNAAYYYWSSSTDAGREPAAAFSAAIVSNTYGYLLWYFKGTSYYARAVRGGPGVPSAPQ